MDEHTDEITEEEDVEPTEDDEVEEEATPAPAAPDREDERLGKHEAVRLFTRGGAMLAALEDKKGSLEPGKQADFAAYEADPLAADSIDGLRPVLTVSLGREVSAR